ncbi:MAG: CHAT domain-containing protein [Cyanobacteria bacterium RM1_2_2]|nr:CHAT domain-containing protein [Cyanobacteria bacterium RM1_2_2]
MPATFTFDLSQQHFELRCGDRVRRLSQPELLTLIEECERCYYTGRPQNAWGQFYDLPDELVQMGQRLYRWLDGSEGWLRRVFNDGMPQVLMFDLIQSREVQALNRDTDRIGLRLAHLPWELLHDGGEFLLKKQLLTMPPIRVVQQRMGQSNLSEPPQPENRPLHLLLMATSPEHPGIADLQYEQEEANILQATRDQPLLPVVEESGSVQELANLVRFYPQGYFDVFHLTGHGLIFTEQDYGSLRAKIQAAPIPDHTPCFVTEDDVGGLQLTTVADLARAFGNRFPKLVFLSGCHTGEVPDQGSVPSMAQALVQAGVPMVLGWARPVYDTTAIVAAEALYKALAAGDSVEWAIQATVAAMLQAQCPDWHLLRVYRDSRPLAELVTPLRTIGREKLKPIQAEQEFLDAQDEVKVASQYGFVGRRRPLQRCLKALKETSEQTGVFIQGMGGLGKSTLAARLCRRMRMQRQTMQQVVLVGVLTEQTLLQKLSRHYEQFPQIPELLNQPGVTLKGRLQNFFEAIEALDRPLLLVLDDFEQNIPEAAVADGSLNLVTTAYDILATLNAALEASAAVSRLIVTCRYLCPLPPHHLHVERLAPMKKSDIDKKCRLLPDYADLKKHPQYKQVLTIADGNPRLLEWLLKLLQQPQVDTALLLSQLEETEQNFRENVLAELLLSALTEPQRQGLAKLSVFRLPVTREIADAVLDPPIDLIPLLNLSLIESATTHAAPEYRVPTILEPLLANVLIAEEWQITQQQAAQTIYRVWYTEADSCTEERGLGIVRLGLLAHEQEIAVSVGDRIAAYQVNNSRFVEALNLCQDILSVFQDYRILGTIARAETVLGQVNEALAHYQQALNTCPEDDIERKAATLGNMAQVIAAQGNIEQAMQLWQQSLQLYEQIGDVRGKAVTLGNMATVAYRQGETQQALELFKQVAQALGEVRAYVDLVTVLNHLGATAEANALVYLAQAIWLCLRVQAPLADAIVLIRYMFNAVPQGVELEALLAAMACWLCNVRGEKHPQLAQLQEDSLKLLSIAAQTQGIETQADFEAWFAQEQLNDPAAFLPRLNQRLEAMIGDGWLFDPNAVTR